MDNTDIDDLCFIHGVPYDEQVAYEQMKEAEENYDSWLERVRESYGY